MSELIPDSASSGKGQFLVYEAEDGRIKIDVRLDEETLWLSQAQLAELFQTSQQNVSLHIRNIFEEGELAPEATHKKYLLVRAEGGREVKRLVDHFSLDMIISVGYRVKSHVATRFRIWATQRLKEYIIKGFTLDDERLKNPPHPGHQNLGTAVLPEDHRHLRHQHRLRPDAGHQSDLLQDRAEQNALGHHRADRRRNHPCARRCQKPHMGLTSWRGVKVRKQDVGIAKNYLNEDELLALNNLAEQYLIFAEGQALRRIPMHMADWIKKLDGFLNINDRDILTRVGKISHEMAQQRAEAEYEQYHQRQIAEQARVDSDFDLLAKRLMDGKVGKKKP